MPYSSLPVCQIFYDFVIFQGSEINFWAMPNGYYWGASEFGLWAEVQTCRWLQPKPVCMYSLYLYSMCWVTKKNGLFLGVEKQILLHLFCIHKSRSPKVYMCRNSLETRDVRHNDVHAQWPLPLKIQIWIYIYLLVWFKNNQGVNGFEKNRCWVWYEKEPWYILNWSSMRVLNICCKKSLHNTFSKLK